MESFSNNVCKLKHEFVKLYKGNSHTTEVLPNLSSDLFLIEKIHLSLLHKFLENNPIYSNHISERIFEVDCTIFEGDLNNYWIDSIKHDASYAPFYPTWMLSAFALALEAQNMGFEQTRVNQRQLHSKLKNLDRKWVVIYNHHNAVYKLYEKFNITMIDKYGRPTQDKESCEETIVTNF